ncbi:hypothetical protein PTKIN_Ptkin16aG0507500 [Pterospermum kingtungense]
MPKLQMLNVDDHPHDQLEWKESEVPFLCNGCKELGFGLCYECPNNGCNFILHEECTIRRPAPPFQQFFKSCNFEFYKKNPLPGIRTCDACALDIQGYLYQCSHGDFDLHPCCTNLPPVFSLSDTNMKIYLRKEIKSKCLKCQTMKRPAGKVQRLSYVSSDGSFCYHVACLREACLDNWKRGYFKLDVVADDKKKALALQNLAPKEVALRGGQGQSSKNMKGIKWLLIFLKLVVSAVFGEPFTLISTLFQISQN